VRLQDGHLRSGSEIAPRLPDYNAEAICEALVKQGLESSQEVYMRREERALATLRARWQRYPLRKRAQCIKDGPWRRWVQAMTTCSGAYARKNDPCCVHRSA
jgi:hypothetical protein